MSQVRKAIAAFIVAGTGSLAAAAVDNSISLGEWIVALAAACAAGGAVYRIPNGPASDPGQS